MIVVAEDAGALLNLLAEDLPHELGAGEEMKANNSQSRAKMLLGRIVKYMPGYLVIRPEPPKGAKVTSINERGMCALECPCCKRPLPHQYPALELEAVKK